MIGIDSAKETSQDLLVRIRDEHARERGLCDQLEHMADELPGAPDIALTMPLINALRVVLKRHIVLHEHFLLPQLAARTETPETLELLQKQAAAEHAADESLAHDIADQLELAIAAGRVENAGMLGYMLYCYFEARRRHLVWEEIVILPMASRLLGDDDRFSFSQVEFRKLVASPAGAGDERSCSCCDDSQS